MIMALSVTHWPACRKFWETQAGQGSAGKINAIKTCAGKTSAGQASGANRAIMMALSVIQKHSDLQNKGEN